MAYDMDAEELLSAMAGAPTPYDAALDSQNATLRRRALTDAKIQAMAPQQSQPVAAPVQAPTQVVQAQQQAAPQQEQGGGFDFERAIAGLTGRSAGIANVDNARLAARRQAMGEKDGAIDRRLKQQEFDDRQEDRALSRQQIRDALDPNSEMSQRAAKLYEMQVADMAEMIGDGPGSQLIKHYAGASKGASYKQIKDYADRLETSTKHRIDLTAAGQKRKDREEDLRWKETVHNDSMADRAASRADRRAQNDIANADRDERQQDKRDAAYAKEAGPLSEAEILMDEASELKKKANTGKVANFVQEKIRKPLGFPDKDLLALESKQGEVNASLRKAEAGLSQTTGETINLRKTTPETDMDDDEYDQKQKDRAAQIRLRQEIARQNHPRATGSKPSVDSGKADRARKAIASPNATPQQKANAPAYLNSLN